MTTLSIPGPERTYRETPVYQRFDKLAGKLALAANEASGADAAAINAVLRNLYREYWGVQTEAGRRGVVIRYERRYWRLR